MHTLPRTSITVTVDFEEKAARDATFKFIESRRRGKQFDHCFNGWQYLYSQKLLEFLMAINIYNTCFQHWKAIMSCCCLLPYVVYPLALEQYENLKKQQICSMLTITDLSNSSFLHIAQQNIKCDACIETGVSVTISLKHLTLLSCDLK